MLMVIFTKLLKMINVNIYLDEEEPAKRIVLGLLKKRLVAHAAILPENETLLNLEGEIIEKREYVITAQTKALLFNEVCEYIQQHHTGPTKILSVPITQCNEAFSEIIRTGTKDPETE